MNPDHIELQFTSSAGKTRWNLGTLDELEFDVLSKEVATYNRWIVMLEKGEAPESSYVGPDADESIYRYLGRHWSDGYVYAAFQRPFQKNLYLRWDATLTLKKKFKPQNHDTVYESVKYLPHFFEAPYSRDLFSCGYKMLPMTQKVLGRLFANVGLNLENVAAGEDTDNDQEPSEDHDPHEGYTLYEDNGDYDADSNFSDDSEIINFNSVEVYSETGSEERPDEAKVEAVSEE